MARKYLTPIDLSGLELTNFKVQNLADNPTAYGKGHAYFNTAHNELRVYDGTAWVPVGGAISYGLEAARPAAGNAGRVFAATDTQVLYLDNGSTWLQIGDAYGAAASAVSAHNSTTSGVHGVTGDVVGTSDVQTLSGKTISDSLSFDGGSGVVGSVADDGSGNLEVSSTTYDLNLNAGRTVNITTTTGDIILAADGTSYLGTAAAGNEIAKISDIPTSADDISDGSTNHFYSETLAYTSIKTDLVAGNGVTLTPDDGLLTVTVAADTDVMATKAYVDSVAQGLNVKDSVAAATTGAILLDGTATTVDGYTLLGGERILVKNQGTASQNGIYVTSLTTAWERAVDHATPEVGDFVFIEYGSTQAKQGWIATGTGYVWTQFSAAGEYVHGDGITISNNTIAVNIGGALYADPGTNALSVSVGTGLTINGSNQIVPDSTYGVRKIAATVGDNTNTSFDVTHNFGTEDVAVTIYDLTTKAEVFADVVHATNKVTVSFAVKPATDAYRVVVVG